MSYQQCSTFISLSDTALINNVVIVYLNFKKGYFYKQCTALLIHPSLYSLLTSPPLLNWKHQSPKRDVRIHIIFHFNHISFDLHLLNKMIIARLVWLMAYGSLEQDLSHKAKPSAYLYSCIQDLAIASVPDYQGISCMSFFTWLDFVRKDYSNSVSQSQTTSTRL